MESLSDSDSQQDITCDYCGKQPKPDSGEEWVSFGGGTWFHNMCWRAKLRGRRTWKRAVGWKWEEVARINREYERARVRLNGGVNAGDRDRDTTI